MSKILLPSPVYKAFFHKPTILRLIESILTSAIFVGLGVTGLLTPESIYGKYLLLIKFIATFTVLRSWWFMSYFNPKETYKKQ